jgi:hypothetical protein
VEKLTKEVLGSKKTTEIFQGMEIVNLKMDIWV